MNRTEDFSEIEVKIEDEEILKLLQARGEQGIELKVAKKQEEDVSISLEVVVSFRTLFNDITGTIDDGRAQSKCKLCDGRAC